MNQVNFHSAEGLSEAIRAGMYDISFKGGKIVIFSQESKAGYTHSSEFLVYTDTGDYQER